MNAVAILTLISDLYSQAATLQAENERLREALAATAAQSDGTPAPMPGINRDENTVPVE